MVCKFGWVRDFGNHVGKASRFHLASAVRFGDSVEPVASARVLDLAKASHCPSGVHKPQDLLKRYCSLC